VIPGQEADRDDDSSELVSPRRSGSKAVAAQGFAIDARYSTMRIAAGCKPFSSLKQTAKRRVAQLSVRGMSLTSPSEA
jgi:hypothetical protein